MAQKILESVKTETIKKRFQIIASILAGKHDISTGRPSEDMVADVELSASAIRNFLNKLHELGFVRKEFIPAGCLPVCSGMGWPNHNEYHLTEEGIRYVIEQLSLWEPTPSYERITGEMIKGHIQKMASEKKKK
ncbi:hypothetical protein [Desulforhabdus amnigena]|jgi:predicted transcriptional regulator|uniref:Uncharacterized protein n=1 Tax=Desulforhabdus amnigena TaxID=40218 RepID=A0A9W6FUM2_9BACT|nr:hypothetical protein [Desulforhabdus amnigena]NLJ28935.1 hypothetical protein [Deltaproteobacteria bacterium]GLI35200.1 hypothetical protein DAMNIGENAA_26330 [Desulforhabdus amnigena]